MKYYYDMYKCILLVNKNINKEWFLEKAGTKNGYARDMFSRLFDSIFAESMDVIKIYRKYYRQEFDSWEDMLYYKYCIPKDMIKFFHDALKENHNLTIIDFDTLSYGEIVDDFLFSDKLRDRIQKLIIMDI